MLKIFEADVLDPLVTEELRELHKECFGSRAPMPTFDLGHWWFASNGVMVVGFAGMLKSRSTAQGGYLFRVGVLENARGNGLQLRFIRVRERKARQLGMAQMVSDTCDSIVSANNLIHAGYRLYAPEKPWSFPHACYWRKYL